VISVLLLSFFVSTSSPPPTFATDLPPWRWERPWLFIKANAELPAGFGPSVEVMVHDLVSIGGEVTFGLTGTFYRVTSTFWPELRTARGAHQFWVGAGVDLSVNATWPPSGATFVATANIDLRYLGRPWRKFGFVIGSRFGVGGAFDTNDLKGYKSQPLDHLAIAAVLYVGIAIGTRSLK
jgi:hypothetical protein